MNSITFSLKIKWIEKREEKNSLKWKQKFFLKDFNSQKLNAFFYKNETNLIDVKLTAKFHDS